MPCRGNGRGAAQLPIRATWPVELASPSTCIFEQQLKLAETHNDPATVVRGRDIMPVPRTAEAFQIYLNVTSRLGSCIWAFRLSFVKSICVVAGLENVASALYFLYPVDAGMY